jgi:putative transposase
MATRNALNNVGYDIGPSTIQRILAERGIEPAPERKRQYSWATFIKAQLGVIVGMDFLTVEVVTAVGLLR